MPDLPLAQMAYLSGVLCAFALFMVTLAWGYFQSNRRMPQPQRNWRSAGAGQGGQAGAVDQAQTSRAFQA